MNERLKEIRKVLLGQTQKLDDGSIMAAAHGRRIGGSFQGVSRSWGAMHFLGITHRARSCSVRTAIPKGRMREILSTQGELVYLEKSPEVLACLCRSWMLEPVLLTAWWNGKQLIVYAYTARGIFAPLACRRTLKALEKKLPGKLEQYREKTPRNKLPDRSAKKNRQKKAAEKKPQKNAAKKNAKKDGRSDQKKSRRT